MEGLIDHELQIKEKSFFLVAPLFAMAALVWSVVYFYYGAKTSAIIPAVYATISILSLLIYRWHRNYYVFRNVQLVLILLLPPLLHLSLGNFISSSAVILWSTLCPLGALAFHSTRYASFWFFAFIIVIIAAFFLENKIFPVETKLPEGLIKIFFALNIAAVTFLNFFVLRNYVNQNELIKKQLKTEQTLLAAEREKSEKLLLNILPSSVAERLKNGDTIIANEYAEAGVLFADIVGFTGISQQTSPSILIENLNKIFTHFDNLVEKQGLEKIKTIGDSYMVVSGLTKPCHDHLKKMSDLALMMMADIPGFSLDGKQNCEVRIGIHVGPVIAGVIGSKKFSYDVWGDTVNTASRMESSSEPGKIQISEKFYGYIKDEYECEYRGQTEIKGKGLMKLYFLKERKQLSIDSK